MPRPKPRADWLTQCLNPDCKSDDLQLNPGKKQTDAVVKCNTCGLKFEILLL